MNLSINNTELFSIKLKPETLFTIKNSHKNTGLHQLINWNLQSQFQEETKLLKQVNLFDQFISSVTIEGLSYIAYKKTELRKLNLSVSEKNTKREEFRNESIVLMKKLAKNYLEQPVYS
jgi:hypothetical protein